MRKRKWTIAHEDKPLPPDAVAVLDALPGFAEYLAERQMNPEQCLRERKRRHKTVSPPTAAEIVVFIATSPPK